MTVVQFRPRTKRSPTRAQINEQVIALVASAGEQLFSAIRLWQSSGAVSSTHAGAALHLSAATSELLLGIQHLTREMEAPKTDDPGSYHTNK